MIIFFWRQIADETLESLTLLAIPTSLVSKKSGAIQMSEAVSFCGMFRTFTFLRLDFSQAFDKVFPECVARVPVSLWGSGVEGVFARRCFRVRNRPQPFV